MREGKRAGEADIVRQKGDGWRITTISKLVSERQRWMKTSPWGMEVKVNNADSLHLCRTMHYQC